jgi:nucleoid-associated protein YgaU
MSRFTKRKVFNNVNELYQEMAEERDVNKFRQYETPNFKYPTSEELANIKYIRHVWVSGDKFFKLSHQHYGDPQLWWVIAWFNKIPTESHAKKGQIILIPKPLGKILTYLRNETHGRF